MKNLKWALVAVMVGVFAFAMPVAADDEGLGEWVSEAAPKGESKIIPPGQFAAMAKYAAEFLYTDPSNTALVGGNRALFASGLNDGNNDPAKLDELDDFFIVDVRKYDEYCKGTVPGAINIPMNVLFQAQNLQRLPSDQPILLVCNSGHTASVVNGLLGAMGYNAWTLRFGMIGWRTKSSVTFADSKASITVDNFETLGKDGQPYMKGFPAYMPSCP